MNCTELSYFKYTCTESCPAPFKLEPKQQFSYLSCTTSSRRHLGTFGRLLQQTNDTSGSLSLLFGYGTALSRKYQGLKLDILLLYKTGALFLEVGRLVTVKQVVLLPPQGYETIQH